MLKIVKNILVIVKGPTQQWEDTTPTAESECFISFSEQGKKSCLSLH